MAFRLLLFLLLFGGGPWCTAAEVLPPAPARFVTDEAGVIPAALLGRMNARLSDFEKRTSNQVVAVVARALPDGASLEDYAQRLYSAWKIGTKKDSNGVLILVFIQDRKVRIQPGYGLEGALPDALCSRIIRETIAPAFRSGNYGAGIDAALTAVMKATGGEYAGKGVRNGESSGLKDLLFSPLGFFLLVLGLLLFVSRNRRDVPPGGVNPGAAAATGFFLGSMGGSGGSGGGDSGGFSGGGGESGGGGASGDW
jgi:uncharacterized protein